MKATKHNISQLKRRTFINTQVVGPKAWDIDKGIVFPAGHKLFPVIHSITRYMANNETT